MKNVKIIMMKQDMMRHGPNTSVVGIDDDHSWVGLTLFLQLNENGEKKGVMNTYCGKHKKNL